MKKKNYQHTIYACYTGYIVQAIVNNFAPLLFLMFQKIYAVSLDKIALLVTINFGVQLIVDMIAARFIDKIGYRISIVAAHVFSAIGLIGLAVLPPLFENHYLGLITAAAVYAIGGGLIEVLVSPIVEACPTDNKEGTMSLLHSFYCWGHVAVVLSSTLFFVVIGIENWKLLACLWAIIPAVNAICFCRVPILTLVEENNGISIRELMKIKAFWILMILMVCAGASEQAMSQWASAFAESGLKVSKTIGDLAGPCLFAILMGCARAFYGKFSEKIKLFQFMTASSILCIISYLVASLTSIPAVSLIGCGLCGLSVGIMWPGTFSIAARQLGEGEQPCLPF